MILPFSYFWILRKYLHDYKTVLDVGCGDGDIMQIINRDHKYTVTGIDLFKPAVAKAKKTGVYKEVMVGDIRKLHLKPKSFDVVFSSQVVEHLNKKEAIQLIKEMEKIARKRVIIATTVGFLPYHPIEGDDDNNPLQVHKSGWEIDEFREMGYAVRGQGSRAFYKEEGVLRKLPRFLHPILLPFAYALSPLNYLFPKQMGYLQIAVKNI